MYWPRYLLVRASRAIQIARENVVGALGFVAEGNGRFSPLTENRDQTRNSLTIRMGVSVNDRGGDALRDYDTTSLTLP